jgi:hypothetical protein
VVPILLLRVSELIDFHQHRVVLTTTARAQIE